MRFLVIAVTLVMALGLSSASFAQSRQETLADIRQELSILYVEVQRLKRELSTTGAPTTTVGGNTPLQRIDAIEAELQRLTSKSEELEFRINQVVNVGTNQIGDLEFRLCELEEGCDLGSLSEDTTLGNVQASEGPVTIDPAATGGAELAVGEQVDFDQARALLDAGDYQAAAEKFAMFAQTYTGGPLSSEAHFFRGDALERMGDIRGAARAYLDSFSNAPNGSKAPDALFKVGTTLGALGQTADACQMLEQVGVRFPGTLAMQNAQTSMRDIGCS